MQHYLNKIEVNAKLKIKPKNRLWLSSVYFNR